MLIMALIRKFSLCLCVIDKFNDTKAIYHIDDSRSLHIMYNLTENSYLITFKNNRKQELITCRKFNIIGNTYAK